MIGGIRTSLYDIIKNYDQEEIFQHMGFDTKASRLRNPFRLDRNPSCYFSQGDRWLFFVDLATPEKRFSCLDMLRKFLKTESINVAINYIRDNFQPVYDIHEVEQYKDEIKIKIVARPWEGYFEDINVTDEQLVQENMYLVGEYWCNTRTDHVMRRNRFGNKFTIAYHFPKSDHTKLYFPGQELRFYTNCGPGDIWGEDVIQNPKHDTLIITKSGKDYLTLKYNYPYDVIALQSESTPLLLKPNKHRRVYTLFDNDYPGIINSYHLPYKNIILPEIDLFSKDPYDYFQVLGKEKLGNLLKECI